MGKYAPAQSTVLDSRTRLALSQALGVYGNLCVTPPRQEAVYAGKPHVPDWGGGAMNAVPCTLRTALAK